jgi:hypothetical protein
MVRRLFPGSSPSRRPSSPIDNTTTATISSTYAASAVSYLHATKSTSPRKHNEHNKDTGAFKHAVICLHLVLEGYPSSDNQRNLGVVIGEERILMSSAVSQ